MKPKIRVVTGYIPILGHPRSAAAYGSLGEKLRELRFPVQSFYGTVSSTWLYMLIAALRFEPTWSVADNPQKNTLAYHCVQHQKFAWLFEAAEQDRDADMFVWLDYGICHVPGVNTGVINECLDLLRVGDFAIPGCWPRCGQIDDGVPCWRFCGGFLVVPRSAVKRLLLLVQLLTARRLLRTRNVTWEVNTLARVEQTDNLPIRWYQADHNEAMFTNYAKDLP